MKILARWFGLSVVLIAVLAACGSNDPAATVNQGAELLSVTFDSPDAWESGEYPVDAETPSSVLGSTDGHYTIRHTASSSSSFVWGTGGADYDNVIVEVQAEQLSEYDNNLYGIGCRLASDERGRLTGYVLLISGDGHYGIAELRRGSLSFLLDWRQSSVINEGQATNTLRAECVDDYFALYANGEFLGDVRSSAYPQAGQIGLVAGVNRSQSVTVGFDDLAVYEGSLAP